MRANRVDHPGEYRWSSHNLYLGARKHDWLTQDYVPAMFGSTCRGAIKKHRAYMDEAADEKTYKLMTGTKWRAGLRVVEVQQIALLATQL